MAKNFTPVSTLAIVGVGLLGGSVALASRRREIARRIIAVGRPEGSQHAAAGAGIVDEASNDLAATVSTADIVVLCTPVERIVTDLPVVMEAVREGTLVTDVGSTKATIVAAADVLASRGFFVGSHPMAGSEKTGWRHATANLFEGAPAIVTPSERTSPDAAARCAAFWRALGARPQFLGPTRHDELVALVSHAPHFVAVALAESLRRSGEDPELLARLSGPGLRDTTRVAMGSPEMWLPIARHNARALADALDASSKVLGELSRLLREEKHDRFAEVVEGARSLRQRLQREG